MICIIDRLKDAIIRITDCRSDTLFSLLFSLVCSHLDKPSISLVSAYYLSLIRMAQTQTGITSRASFQLSIFRVLESYSDGPSADN